MKYYLLCFIFLLVHFSAFANNTSEACQRVAPIKAQAEFEACKVNSDTAGPNTISVAIRHAPPFIYETENHVTGKKQLKGIAIDFWEEIAARLDIDYQYRCLNLPDTLKNLSEGSIDLAISPLTITKAREQAFDFSHQYFNSGLVFAARPGESRFDFNKAFNTLKSAFSSQYIFYLVIIFFTLLLIFILLALKNIKIYQTMPIMVNRSKPSMVFHIILYSILNICGIRKDVFGFASVSMQLFSLIVLIFGITVSASLFGMVTAALTKSVSEEQTFSAENMESYRIATLSGSTAQSFLCASKKQPVEITLTDTWQEALNQVVTGQQDVVLGDWVQLVYLTQQPQLKKQIKVQGQSLQFEPYGWGLKSEHPLKDRINQELIDLLRHQAGPEIIRRYIGDNQIDIHIN